VIINMTGVLIQFCVLSAVVALACRPGCMHCFTTAQYKGIQVFQRHS
jgi:hypothetical protein